MAPSHPSLNICTRWDEERRCAADSHIVETWATGWALSRGTPAPVRSAGAFRIDVGLPQHKARYMYFLSVATRCGVWPTPFTIPRFSSKCARRPHEQHRRRGLGRVVMNALPQTAAGGLTGLTFVVITLAADAHRVRPVGVKTFVMSFCRRCISVCCSPWRCSSQPEPRHVYMALPLRSCS
jgi:hypothetical protein